MNQQLEAWPPHHAKSLVTLGVTLDSTSVPDFPTDFLSCRKPETKYAIRTNCDAKFQVQIWPNLKLDRAMLFMSSATTFVFAA
jgi:hypothetical protein